MGRCGRTFRKKGVGDVFVKTQRGRGYVLWGVVRYGGRGCLSVPMSRHPFPLRDQPHDSIV